MRTLVLILIVCVVCAGCTDRSAVSGKLTIERSFKRTLEFQFREENGAVTLRSIVRSGVDDDDKGKVFRNDIRKLTAEEAEALVNAVKGVLAASVHDPIPEGGRDGSMWTLNVRSPEKRKLRIWTPRAYAEERNTQSLQELGLLLWRLAKIDEPETKLY